ncbi:hypothetical protein LTR36_009982 [Oleoguttula mirabilis]|uniref:Serine/threonine-protein phosphatase 2A activator n=1 Tax=Oleoguttula mirabilis TaxID=1507867 RepID=A0AAV9J4P1_9PEZI|nr:hypothetical protein LTR36_009982 [Oleoguttula mirabilis]
MDNETRRNTTLKRLRADDDHTYANPAKRINDGDDLNFFLASTAYRDLSLWLLQLNRSMFPTKDTNGQTHLSDLTKAPPLSNCVQHLRALLDAFATLLERAPPSTGPRRFGNVAFRDWYRLAEEEAGSLLQTHLAATLQFHAKQDPAALIDELKSYLLGSFGSAQRLDYGTGHELSFLAFLGCLWKLGAFEDGEERAIVVGVVQPYLELVRKLIMTYTLEPAGSHGVWGLDDHCFVPYIFGSAQLGPPIDPQDYTIPVPTEGSLSSAPAPSSVAKKDIVGDYKDSNMYFSAIQFIYDVKKGPFWEHSPILYDISGIKDGWAKINKGMLKMYAAEVLGKFPVVQHFPFGSLFSWEQDSLAVMQGGSVHAQQQPMAAAKSKDVPVPAGGVSTAAPWAKAGSGGMPQMQASTGVPSARAPRAGYGGAGRPQVPQAGGMAPTTVPWASTQRPPPTPATAAPWASDPRSQPGITSTAAPWAKRDQST